MLGHLGPSPHSCGQDPVSHISLSLGKVTPWNLNSDPENSAKSETSCKPSPLSRICRVQRGRQIPSLPCLFSSLSLSSFPAPSQKIALSIFPFRSHHPGPSDDNCNLTLHTPKFNFPISFRSSPIPINISGCRPVTYVHKSKKSCFVFSFDSQRCGPFSIVRTICLWIFGMNVGPPPPPSLVSGPGKGAGGPWFGRTQSLRRAVVRAGCAERFQFLDPL